MEEIIEFNPLQNLNIQKSEGIYEKIKESLLDGNSLLNGDFPQPEYILKPWLRKGTVALGYAMRGIGKTWVGLSIMKACTIINSTLFKDWKCENSVNVLYIDGEMSTSDLQKRIQSLTNGFVKPTKIKRGLVRYKQYYVLGSDYLHSKYPEVGSIDLTKSMWREMIIELIEEKEIGLVIVDNLSCLYPGLGENEKENWDPANRWLLKLRFMNVAALVFHHAGKGGEQRGTSGREDNIDVSFKLLKVPGSQGGAEFEFKWDKTRDFSRGDVNSFVAQLESENESCKWTLKGMRSNNEESKLRTFLRHYKVDQSTSFLVERLSVSKSRISQLKREAVEKGYLNSNYKLTSEGEFFESNGV